MFHTVSLEPSGRQFEVRQGESILDAGLRAGVNLRYRCSNGTCGECRARLLDGQVEQIAFHDFCFSAAETAQGCLLTCSATAVSNVRLAAAELGAADDVPQQQVTAKLSKIELIGDEYALVHLRTPRSQTLQFLAGQQVTVQLDGGPSRRLPLANCPCDGLRPQFHIRRLANDLFSERLFDATVQSGAACELHGPFGDFVIDEQRNRPLLFAAYETGFAPVYSLLEHVIALDWSEPLRLLWFVDRAGGLYLENYCRALQDALDDFVFLGVEIGEPERFCASLQTCLRDQPQLCDYDIYAVPPPGQVAAARDALSALGIDGDRLKVAALEAN